MTERSEGMAGARAPASRPPVGSGGAAPERGARDSVDLRRLAATGDGVAWSASPDGVNVNLVVLGPGGAIATHRNDEVDVLVVAVGGHGSLTVDGVDQPLGDGTAVVVPKGATRAIRAGDDELRYLTVHRARGPLGVRGVPTDV